MSFLNWFTDLAPGAGTRKVEEASKSAEAQEKREAGLEQKGDTYFGTNTPIEKDGQQTKTTVNGTEDHSESKWSWLTDTYKRMTGQTTTTSGVDNESGRGVTNTDVKDKTTSEVDPAKLKYASTTENSNKTTADDYGATAISAKKELQARLDGGATLSDEDRAKIQADIAKLGPNTDPATLQQIIAANKLQVKLAQKTLDSTSTKDTTNVDLLNGGANKSTVTSDSKLDESKGTTKTDTTTNTKGVQAGKGALTGSSTTTNSSATTDATGKTLDGKSDSTTKSLGIVNDPNKGTGVAAGKNNSTSTTKDDKTTTNAGGTKATVTDKGAFVGGDKSKTVVNGKDTGMQTTKSAKISGEFGFTVDLAAIPGSSPTQYKVVMTLSESAQGALSAGKQRGSKMDPNAGSGTTGSITGSASESIQLTYTHVMDEAAAREYMANVDAVQAGGASPPAPEFDVISKLKAVGGNGKDAASGGLAVLGSSSASSNLKDGESMELSIGGDARVGGSVGKQGEGGKAISVGAEAGMGATRTVKVERTNSGDSNGRHMNDITVTFVTRNDEKANASGTIEGVTVGGSANRSESHTKAAMVRLDVDDPKYAEKYAQVVGALTPEAVNALATALTTGETNSHGGTLSVGVPGVTLTGGLQKTTSENVTIDKDKKRVEGTTSGQQDLSAGVSTGTGDASIKGVQQKESTNATTTTAGDKGPETTITQESASSSPLRAVGEGWDSLKAWWNKDKSAKDVAQAGTMTPQERLKAQMETTYSSFDQYALSKNDVDTLAARGSDTENWQHCCNSYHYWEQWKAFGRQLSHPPVKAEEAEVNAADAQALARGRVMSSFIAEVGAPGMDYIQTALRHWKQNGTNAIADKQVGTHFEWPNSLVAVKGKWEVAHTRTRTADEYFQRLVGKPDAMTQGKAWYDATSDMLHSAQTAIQGCNDFTNAGAKLEMVDAVNHALTDLDTSWQMSEGTLRTNAPVSAPGQAPVDPATQMSKADANQSVAPAPAGDDAQQVQTKAKWRRISELTQLLTGFKAEEKQQYARARALTSHSMGGELEDGTLKTMWKENWDQAFTILNTVGSDLHQGWITHVQELRGIYKDVGVPDGEWLVSLGPNLPRNLAYEPDMAGMKQIYTSSSTSTQRFSEDARRDQEQKWEQQAKSY